MLKDIMFAADWQSRWFGHCPTITIQVIVFNEVIFPCRCRYATTAKRTELTGKAYTFAISTGPQLQLLDRRDQLPAHGQALICERTINLAAAKLGHNCKSPINGLASMAVQ